MRSKLLGRLMSVALSATVALTSGIPALAYDGGEGDLLDDEEEIQLLDEEEEIGSDFDVLEEDIVEEKEFFATEDGETVFESTDDVTITFANTGATAGVAGTATAGTTSHAYVLDPDSLNGMSAFADNGTKTWDSSKDYVFDVIPAEGYVIDDTTVANVTVTYAIDADTDVNESAVLDAGFACAMTEEKATITVYSNFLKQYKSAVAAASNLTSSTFTVSVGAITKADSYLLKVVGTSIAATNPLLTLTCGQDRITDTTKTATDALDLSDFELSTAPITGVEVYKGEVKAANKVAGGSTSKTDFDGDTDYFFFDTTSKKLYIGKNLIKLGYDAGKDLTVVALSEGFTISQDPENKAEFGTGLKFNLTGDDTAITSSTDYSKVIQVAPVLPDGVTGRTIDKINYVVMYADDTTKEVKNVNVATGIVVADLTNSGSKATNIVVSATTTEAVSINNATHVKNATVTGTTSTATGKDYVFTLVAAAGYEITEVGYILGALPVSGDPTIVPLALSVDDSYTIPASAVKNQITIVAKGTAISRNVKVSAAISTSGFTTPAPAITTDYTVKDKQTGSSIATQQTVATIGENYDFVISEVSHDYSVKSVKYTLGGGTEEHDDVITVDAKKGVYRIPGTSITDESAIEIKVYSNAMVKVEIPDNTNAILSVNGEAKTADFYVKKGEKFTFSIAGKTSNVEVDKVAYVISGNTTTPDLAASYSIAADAISSGVEVNVVTTETPATDAYSVAFTATSNSNYGWTEATTLTPAAAITTPTATNKVLQIARSDTAVITPVITLADKSTVTVSPNTGTTDDKIKYEQVSELEGTAQVVAISQTSATATTATLASKQIGTETMKYTITDRDSSSLSTQDSDENIVVYTGTLDIEVLPHYTIELAAAASATSVTADATAFKAALGTDAKVAYAAKDITGKREQIDATVTNTVTHVSVAKSSAVTTPAITVKWAETTGNKVFYVTKGSATTNSGGTAAALTAEDFSARIAAADVSATPGSFTMSITEGKDASGKDVVYTAEEPVELYAVEGANLDVAVTVKFAGGEEKFISGASAVTLDATDLTKATITYRTYKLDSGKTIATNYNSQALLDAAVAAETIEEIEDAAYEVKYYKTGDTTKKIIPSFLTISGANGEYTATASAKGTYTVDLEAVASINNEEKAAPVLTFTVNEKAERVSVPLYLNDATTVIKLGAAYLKGKTYSADATSAATDDGYLFKIAKGTTFTLPTESDLSTASYTDTTRKLVGWNITASANAINGEGSALTNKYYMPGQEIIVDATLTSVKPLWADRYAVDDAKIYRDLGKTKTNTVTIDSLVDNTPKTDTETGNVPDDTAKLVGDATIPVGSNVKLGIVVDAARTNATTTTVSYNELYPTSGVVWSAYDTTAGGSSLPDTAANAEARATNTILDKEALANGYLKGVKPGYTFVYPTYTDELGNKYVSDAEVKVTVTDEVPEYTLNLSKLPDEIEVGQEITTTAANGVVMTKDGSNYVSAVATTNDTFTYTITGGIEIEDGATNRTYPVIKGTAAGTATLSLTVTDANGLTVTSPASKTITVKPASVTINLTDEKGKSTTETPVVAVGGTATTLYVTATNTDGDYATGTWTYKSSDTTILNDGGTGFAAASASNANIMKLTGAVGTALGTTTITVTFTSGSKIYKKDIELKSYYGVTFDADAGLMVTGSVATPGDLASKVKVTDAAGEAQTGDYVAKIFKEDVDTTTGKFSLDLTGYKAVYEGTSPIEFVGWTSAAAVASKDKALTALKDVTAGVVTLKPVFADATITNINSSVSTITLNNADTDLTNGATYDPVEKAIEISTMPKESVATVAVESSVSNTGTTDAFFIWDDDDTIAGAASTDSLALGTGTAGATDTARKFDMIVGTVQHKVGTATLTVSAVGSDAKNEIALTIYGEYADSEGERYRKADGTDAVDTSVKVEGTDKYYDENGYLIKENGTGHDADGNLVLLKAQAGAVAGDFKGATIVKTDGYHASFDAEGNDYFTEDGKVVTGLVKVNGVQRYANTKGVLVTYQMTVIQGTPGIYTDPVSGDTYTIEKEDNAAEEDKLFTVASKVWTWTKASDGKTFASAKVVFTSTDGRTKEITVPVAKMTVTTEGELTKYVAAASFKSKGTEISATDTKYLDAEGNEVIPHDHVWTAEWKWTDVEGDVEKKTAALTLTCKVDAENPHTETLSKTVTAEKNGLVWTWTASFEYDGKTFTNEQKEVRDEQTGEEIEVEDISGGKGIVITLYRDEYNYTGSPIKPTEFSVLDLERDSDYYLNPGTEYSVSYKNNTKVGEAEIIIKGKGNYAGKATSAKFKIVNPYPDDVVPPVVKGATLKLPKATYIFNNEDQFPATVEFGLKGETAKTYTFEGGSYVDSEGNPLPAAWTCENNRNAGTATFSVLGQKDAKGQPTVVKKTFTIKAATLDTTNYKILVGSQEKDFEIEWFAKGATPWVDIVWANGDNEYGLWSGKDFTVSYKDNKKVGTASVSIKGKGNFKGQLKNVATFKINALDLGETWLQAVTVKAGNKGKQVKVTVVDHHDNIIPASKYTVSVTDASTGADLTNTKLTAGMEILVKAVAKDSTAVTGETAERPVTIAADFSKASVKVASSFYKEYTGQAIELTDEDMKNITVTIKVGKDKKTLVYGEDFFIAGTADNVNKGTMTVTIVGNAEADTERGIPAFSGSKTFKVKIKARQLPLK